MNTGPRILLVELDPLVRETLASALTTGCAAQVWVAREAAEGVELALQHQPDLILMDLGVPDLDGLALCQAIAEHSELMHTKLWIMTGVTLDHRTRSALRCYADRLIQMPLSATALSREILNEVESCGPPLRWLSQ